MRFSRINLLYLFFLSFTLSSSFSFSQDVITKKDGASIEAKIELIGIDEIKYKKFDNPEGPSYIISKTEVKKIVFENGTSESFNQSDSKKPKAISIEETKAFIVETINNHGYDRDDFKWKFKANFEGKLLRLTHLKKNSSSEPKNKGLLYDFSNVYKFQSVSKRSDKLAFLNIWVSVCENEKKDKWDKEKLVLRVDDPNIAESLLNALKHYNDLLLKSESSDKKHSKF